jgi:hypothetical protein
VGYGRVKHRNKQFLEERKNTMKMNNYERVITQAIADGTFNMTPGSVSFIHCYHDEDCGINSGKPCDCQVEVVQTVMPPDKPSRLRHKPLRSPILSKGQNESVINSTNAGNRNN